jgi:hypothetical protein
MSATGSLMIRNLKSKGDYAKAVITQDDLLRVAIANQNNISTARKELKDGITPTALPQTQKTAFELQQDLGLQESTAIQNLSQLFKYTEVSTIVARLTSDEIFVLNQAFPAIKKDLENKFDVKLLTPTFFIDYLKKYIEELNESKGVSTNLSNMTNKFNQLTTEIRDIKNYLPDDDLLLQLHSDLQGLRLPRLQLEPVLDRIDALALYLPNKNDFLLLQNKTDVDRNIILQELQTATADLPTRDYIQDLHNKIVSGTIPRDIALQKIEDIVNSVSAVQVSQLAEIKQDLKQTAQRPAQPKKSKEVKPINPTPQSFIDFEYMLDDPNLLPVGFEMFGTGRTANASGKYSKVKSYNRDPDDNEWYEMTAPYINQLVIQIPQFKEWSKKSFRKATPSQKDIKDYIEGAGQIAPPLSPMSPSSTISTLMGTPRSTASTFMSLFNPSRAVSSTNPTTQTNATTKTKGYGLGGHSTMGKAIYSGARPTKKVVFGKGIDLEREPLYKTFGKFIVNIPTLRERDVLHLKYPSLSRIPEFPPKPVSEDFRDFFIDTIDNGKVNHKVFKTLDDEEKKLFERIAEKAGLFKGLGLTKQPNKEDEEEVNRFNILRGEYYAGNNSHQLLDELRKLIIKFIHNGRIGKNEGIQILSQLIN